QKKCLILWKSLRFGQNTPRNGVEMVALDLRRRSVTTALPTRGAVPTDERETYVSVNRTDLVAAIAEKASLTKTNADAALSALQEVLVESLGKGEAVKVTGLLSVER